MKKFIFGQRSGIYVIDLEKTEENLNQARDFLMELASRGEYVLFVGTKKQAQEIIRQEAVRAGMYYVAERWPGGLLTNFSTVKKSIDRLKEIEKMHEDGTFEKLTKKEVAGLEKEAGKLRKNFSGIVQMEKMPGAIFIVDTKKEETAVREARRLSIPIVAFLDTNCNPDPIAYPIPGNDDASKSVLLVTSLIADSIIEGRKKFLSYLSESGSVLKKEESGEETPAVLPEEEAEIKEIEEIVEESSKEEPKAEAKPPKKEHSPRAGDAKTKNKKKA